MKTTSRCIACSLAIVTLLAAGMARAQESPPAPMAAPAPGYPPAGAYYDPAYPPPPQTSYQVVYPQRRGALPPGMELPYYEGQPIPPGYRVVTRVRKGLVIGGALTMGIPWALSAASAAGNDYSRESGWLLIPGLGPWLMLAAGGAHSDCDNSSYSYCYDDSGALRFVLVLDGIVQTAGLVMLASGLYFPSKRLIRGDVTVSALPTRVGADGYGIGLHGTF